jgi:hypothetical protein
VFPSFGHGEVVVDACAATVLDKNVAIDMSVDDTNVIEGGEN